MIQNKEVIQFRDPGILRIFFIQCVFFIKWTAYENLIMSLIKFNKDWTKKFLSGLFKVISGQKLGKKS